jgi:hypothetical protein
MTIQQTGHFAEQELEITGEKELIFYVLYFENNENDIWNVLGHV